MTFMDYMDYMDPGERAVVQETATKIKGHENILHFTLATKNYYLGANLAAQQDYIGATEKYKAALKELDNVADTNLVHACIQAALASACAMSGKLEQAIALGKEALIFLSTDRRLAIPYAGCLHDTGAALAQSGCLNEGLDYMENALRIYETVPYGGDLAANCMNNIMRIRGALRR